MRLADPRVRSALRIAVIFLIMSYIYLYGSDWLVESIVPVEWLFAVNVSKGFIYVTVTAVGLFYFINRALAETHAAEDRFKLIFDASPDGIVLATLDGVIEAANPAISRISGWGQSELIGMTRDDLFDTSAQEVQNAIRYQHQHGDLHQRLMMRRKDGKMVPIFASVGVFTLPDGQLRACCLFRELTSDELHEAKYREGERQRLVGHLAGNVAHDFNNLLTVISSNTELLLEKVDEGSPQSRAINIIGKATQQATQLVQQLLAFARRQSLNTEPFSVKDRLSAILPLLEKAVGSHVLNSADALRDDTKVTIEAGNLTIGNQSYYADVLVEGDYVTVSVSDHGTGMPRDVLLRAVEPFFTTKESGHGIGLGLSTVFGFAKQSGGHMDIRSEAGTGTVVTILLPRSVNGQTPSASELGRRDLVGGNEHILVIEEDALVRGFLDNALSQLGYKVLAADDLSGALELLGVEGPVDILVADAVLSRDTGGSEMMASLKASYPDMAVLFISGFPDERRSAEGEDGAPAPEKSFQVHDLAKNIRNTLDQKAAAKAKT